MATSLYSWIAGVLLLILYFLASHATTSGAFKHRNAKTSFLGSKRRLPPGPLGQPVVGNLVQLFRARSSGRFAEYLSSMNKYGEMTTLHMGSKVWVLLNSSRVAAEIIGKRGKVTSERPHMPIAGDLVSRGKRTVIRQTKNWIEGRRVMHQLLSGSSLKLYAGMQELESVALLTAYLQDPGRWYSHHYRYATSVLYRIVTGYGIEVKSQAELDDFRRVGVEFIASIHRSPIDFFPQLTRLPLFLQVWRPYWATVGSIHHHVLQAWWDPVKAAVDTGEAPPSFVRDVLLHPDVKYTGDNEEAMYLATSIVAAGGDNTRMTLNTFIMAMMANPEAQARIRAEVDAVCACGELRLPVMDDLAAMPYLAATIKEVLRWRPTVPIVPPHELTENLEFEEFVFPKGTNFLINSLGVSAQADRADEFLPERWMDGTETNAVAGFWGFGGGRRICVGYKVAQQALFVAYSRIIFCFEINPNGLYDSKILNHQADGEPFPVKIISRGKQYEKLIEKAAKNSEMTR